jgi:homopolymeric O-antigen transport system permease protein
MATLVERYGKAVVVGLLWRLWQHRDLLRELVRRDLHEAYAGSVLSQAWAVLHPLLLVSLYGFVFGYVFTSQAGTDMPAEPDFAVFMLVGLATWMTVQAAPAKAANSLVASANLVKQVVFPIELLPVRSVLAAHVPLLIGIAAVVAYSAARFWMVSPLLPLAIYAIVAQLMLLTGVGLFLSALTVYVRDTRDVVQVWSTVGIFLLPIIYPPGSLPHWFTLILYANPFSYGIWCLQDVFFFGDFRHPFAWLMIGLLGLGALCFGYAFFERTRENFGDAL